MVSISATTQNDDDSFYQEECLEISFMHFHDMSGKKDLPMDKIDYTLSCFDLQ